MVVVNDVVNVVVAVWGDVARMFCDPHERALMMTVSERVRVKVTVAPARTTAAVDDRQDWAEGAVRSTVTEVESVV